MNTENLLVQIQKWIENEKQFNQKLIKSDYAHLTNLELEKFETYLNGKIKGMEFLKEMIESHCTRKPIKK